MINAIANIKEITNYYNLTKDKQSIKELEKIASKKFKNGLLIKRIIVDQYTLAIAILFDRGKLRNYSQIIEEVTL